MIQFGVGLRLTDTPTTLQNHGSRTVVGLGPQAEDYVPIPGEIWGGSDDGAEVPRAHTSQQWWRRNGQKNVSLAGELTPSCLGPRRLGKVPESFICSKSREKDWEGREKTRDGAASVSVEASPARANHQISRDKWWLSLCQWKTEDEEGPAFPHSLLPRSREH